MCAFVLLVQSCPSIIILDLRLSTSAKVLVVILPTASHLIVGNFVEPKVC